ncbi:hypothetical protein H2509_02535 [Stappia sp. F7233]|uniref:Uncharacterized protein n=1 Tax=Stappia albiluteola TaxID=2758565 RepID=A0A839AAD0_9HYPH|nr:hypothetical protein [Stappia albiluteola]MBA5775998.1 hypothetical protein [Stappia albiluteola]
MFKYALAFAFSMATAVTVSLADETVDTLAGPVTVREIPEDFRVEISVAGQPLYYQDDSRTAYIAQTFEVYGAVGVVVVGFNSGGSACPVLYRIVDVSQGAPNLSQQFGSCSDIPKFKVVKGSIQIDFPKYNEGSSERWVYSEGKLKQTR